MKGIQRLDQTITEPLLAQSRAATRQRAHLNLHDSYHDPIQRFLIAMQPASYVRPHYHSEPDKWELFTAIKGTFSFFIFNDQGVIQQRIELSAGESCFGLHLEPGQWHSVIATKINSLFFEVKRGPYCAARDKVFALWAPSEQDPDASSYRHWLQQAQPGERFTR
ncbi:WbuC family cupin fold metalloprotein [Neiella marina]|uniref:WbuC family cupin fold metalloprotein n=1 Tax=Neiella holothuriorum TaxID=2870530 RepID=A0ABS7EIC9_9GAMM|nr:WbuC family cupin fold metalloprotein [Neiella holothuriorum]MBW8192094.1 WbuC family cupin fold metalloprotein [Neiella holothuriorum]